MGLLGPGAGALAAGIVSWVYLAQRFYRQPFGDWGAVGLWVLLVLLDICVLFLAAGGYAVGKGLPSHDATSVAGWIVAGVGLPLTVRSPLRSTRLRGSERQVGVTYVYDWLRATLEDPLDARLADLRRIRERQLAQALAKQGWTAAGVLAELQEHLNYLQRRSLAERGRVMAAARAASKNLPPEEAVLGIVVAVEKARGGRFLAGLKKRTPPR
jgi:hypothetical protein